MKIFLQLVSMLLLNTALHAQQYYFAYVQTDNKQPFYLKMNDKVLSSSASGYVVIPKLSSGNYSVTFGFPKDQFPQQTINLNIASADAGFLLKDFGAKGWGLFNLETMQVAMNNSAGNSAIIPTTSNQDVFSNTLAGAANTDLSVAKKPAPVVVVEEVKPVIVKEETKVIKPATENAIKKINTSSDVDGKSYTYVDHTGMQNDTINVFIAANKITTPAETVKEIAVVKEDKPVVKEAKQESKETKPTKFLDIDMAKTAANNTEPEAAPRMLKNKKSSIAKPEAVINDKPVVSFNSDCKAMANENDFLKIRKKMAAAVSDDAMVDAAKKVFKTTCYSVEQIKNLSALFLNDAGKYNFFDAAYPHIYDSQNFGALQAQLSDQYYISRFKAMIRN